MYTPSGGASFTSSTSCFCTSVCITTSSSAQPSAVTHVSTQSTPHEYSEYSVCIATLSSTQPVVAVRHIKAYAVLIPRRYIEPFMQWPKRLVLALYARTCTNRVQLYMGTASARWHRLVLWNARVPWISSDGARRLRQHKLPCDSHGPRFWPSNIPDLT